MEEDLYDDIDPLGTMSQADRIIDRFGGAMNLARLLKVPPSTVFRWTYPKGKKGGTGGLVPTQRWDEIRKVARQEGIYLTERDLYPW